MKNMKTVTHEVQHNYLLNMKIIIESLEKYYDILSKDTTSVMTVPGFTYTQHLAMLLEETSMQLKTAYNSINDDYNFFGRGDAANKAMEAFIWIKNYIGTFVYNIDNMLDIENDKADILSGLDITLRKLIFSFYDAIDAAEVLQNPDNIPDILKEFAEDAHIDIIVYCAELSDKFHAKPPFALISSDELSLINSKTTELGLDFNPYLSAMNIADLYLIDDNQLSVDAKFLQRLENRMNDDESLFNSCESSLQKVLENTSKEKYILFYEFEEQIRMEFIMDNIDNPTGLDTILDKLKDLNDGGDITTIFTGR